MPVASCPFPYPPCQRAPYRGKIAVAQVERQLLERVADLGQRVVPRVDAVEPFLILHVLDDIARMAQGEAQLVARHGEDAAQAARHGGECGGIVGGIGREAHVVDEVHRRHDGETRAEEHGQIGRAHV